MSDEAPTFEQALQELEEVVARLEEGKLVLEESMTLFERGQELVTLCNKALDSAELRIEKVRSTADETYEVIPFEEPEDG
ncbi:MAG: exodeoxyribonuclease VII small subunit [Anaerolineae bacterium]|nr:exodeoxyribonuclease VII small subunit [Anaerolineae bacterium]